MIRWFRSTLGESVTEASRDTAPGGYKIRLTTPGEVIRRAGIEQLPEYEDVAPMTDCAGFYALRRYPAATELAQIVTGDGRPAVRCYLRFVVLPPSQGSTVSRIDVEAWFARRWKPDQVFSSGPDPYDPAGSPDAPSPLSVATLARVRKPIDLDRHDVGEFLYDHREDAFLDEDGNVVTPLQILEDAYKKHCRTLQLGFRIRWTVGSMIRWVIRQAVWRGQDAAMWALLNLYDVELAEKGKWPEPFRKYKPADFRRTTEKPEERSHFFGFQSSRKSLFTNLLVVAATCILLYWKVPHDGLLRAIYRNPALTTAALVFGFLLADTLGPWLLIRMICALSQVRDAVLFLVRKVRV